VGADDSVPPTVQTQGRIQVQRGLLCDQVTKDIYIYMEREREREKERVMYVYINNRHIYLYILNAEKLNLAGCSNPNTIKK
jgi:hypothetical protein